MRGLAERRASARLAKEKSSKVKNNVSCNCKMCKPHKHWKGTRKFFCKNQLLEEINRKDLE